MFTNHNRLIPVSKWGDFHIYPSQPALRSLIFNASKNGFDKVIRRVGRRILISESEFFLWVDEQSSKNGLR